MKSIFGIFTLIFSVLVSNGVQAQFSAFQGVWQDVQDPTKFYSIHINGTEVVLIDLGGLEESAVTRASAYYGTIEYSTSGFYEARLSVLEINPASPTGVYVAHSLPGPDLYITLGCRPNVVCTSDVKRITKIF